MKIIVEAMNTPNVWQFGSAPELRIYALSDFITDNGQLILRGLVGSDEPHLKVQCTLTDPTTLYIPSFEIDSTPLDRSSFYTAIFTARRRKTPFRSNFAIPPEPSSTTWDAIFGYQRIGKMRFVNPPMAEIQQKMAGMISNALADLRFGSETQVGNVALDYNPVDPSWPTAVATTNPRWLALSERAIYAEGLGVVANGETDDTAAMQAAIDAAVILGAVTIKVPDGPILVDGPLRGTAPYQARLILPFIAPGGNEAVHITIEGVSAPPLAFGSVNSTFQAATKGSIIKSTQAGGAILGCETSGVMFTEAELTLRNLIIRLPDNPSQKGVEASYLGGLHLDHVNVDTGKYTTAIVQPTNAAGVGIVTPLNNNNANQTFTHVQVQGFYVGMTWNEHNIGEHIVITGCRTGLEPQAANHASYIKRLMVFNNTTNIHFTGQHVIKIEQMDIEHANSAGLGTPAWQDTVFDVEDPGNLGRGQIEWHVVKGGVGIDPTFLTDGAALIKFRRLLSKGYPFFGHFSATPPITIASSTAPTVVALTTDNDDIYDLHDPTVNPTRVRFPAAAFNGNASMLLRVTIGIDWAASALGYRSVVPRLNGVTALVNGGQLVMPVSGEITRVNVCFSRKFNAGDYIEILVAQTTGGDLDILNFNVTVEETDGR